MNVRRPVKAVALLGMLGIFLVQHHDAPYAVAELAGSPEFGEFVDGPPEVFIENPPPVFVSRMTSSGLDLSQKLLSTEPDGRFTLAGTESVTVTDESIVVVFDRSTETLRPVTSITTYGNDLFTSNSAESDLFYTDDDGRVMLTRIRSVTVSEDQLIFVLDRALAPGTCDMEVVVTPQPDGSDKVERKCVGTCPPEKKCNEVMERLSAGPGRKKVKFTCQCTS